MAAGKTWTASSDTADSDEHLGVAVVNYRTPRLEGAAEAVANAHRIRQMIEGLKLGLADMDLVVFPPHSAQGLRIDDEALKASGDVLAVLGRACRNARVWGVFSMADPEPATILLNARGELVQAWPHGTPGAVAEGPRGWMLGFVMGPDDDAAAARWIDAERQGAELIVRCRGAHSAIVDVNGEVLGECGDEAYGARLVVLSRRRLHEARALDAGHAATLTSATHDPRSRPAAPPHGAAAPRGLP